jgi:AcrR family transcriptional regulator
MAKKAKTLPGRRPRADAERNRALLLETAKAAFGQKGPGASLEDIARAAGVGIGTLYRHFPTREALIEAVYSSEADQLIKAETRLANSKPPIAALREWLLMFVDYIITKHGLSEVLKSISGSTAYASSSKQVRQAIANLVDRAVASGDVRLEIEPMDLLRALSGVANLSAGPDSKKAAKRMVDILIGGIRI